MGRDRPAVPRAVRVLRRARRTRPARRAVEARARATTSTALTNVFTADHAWARPRRRAGAAQDRRSARDAGARLLRQRRARALHGRAVPRAGLPAVAVWGDSPTDERASGAARPRRRDGAASSSPSTSSTRVSTFRTSTRCCCCARPRARRSSCSSSAAACGKAHGKALCTVLDFVGNHRKEFRFDRRFRALLGGSRARRRAPGRARTSRSCRPAATGARPGRARDRAAKHPRGDPDRLARASATSFASLGDVVARRRTSRRPASNSKTSTPATTAGRSCAERSGCRPTLPGPTRTRCSGRSGGCCTSTTTSGSTPTGRSSQHDHRPTSTRSTSASGGCSACSSGRSRRSATSASLDDAVAQLWEHPQVRAELLELLDVLPERVDHLHHAARRRPDVPLARARALHAGRDPGRVRRRRRRQAADLADRRLVGRTRAQTDLFAFTLDKSVGGFSPTTRYRDYAISPELDPLGEPVGDLASTATPGSATSARRATERTSCCSRG